MAYSEDHIIQSTQHVARQRENVADLEYRGEDVSGVRALFDQFEETPARHARRRDGLRNEFDAHLTKG